MSTLDPRLAQQLDRLVPDVAVAGDWGAIVAGARRRSRRRRLSFLAVGVAMFALAAATPLGGAIVRGVGGFSAWLGGTPGNPASPSAQRSFDRANVFRDHPRLHELLHVNLDGRRFDLFGFETGDVVCLRVTVERLAGAGPQAACASRADLRRSGDLVLPVKANLGLGMPSRYLVSFGLAAASVAKVAVETDAGKTAAVVRNGAFFHVLERGGGAVWARAVVATTRAGRSNVVPISVEARGASPLRTGLVPHGPGRAERRVSGGTIGWFVRREPRGVSARAAGLLQFGGCCMGFVRVIYPDPGDFLAVAISDHLPIGPPGRRPCPAGKDAISIAEIARAGIGETCTTLKRLFREGPLAVSWGFSGGGQQIWVVSGLASDDVARIEVFQGDGRHWRAPLRDNATAFRIQRAKFPVRVVAYDDAERVIDVRTLRGG